ncbi:MAG: hypothetical protein WC655_08605 [Candidatus Hydrogenedentales bacterium]|jgi:hypothetical protein
MNYTKTVLCLANSRKYQGRCVAGKVYEAGVFGEWVRPVTTRAWEAIDPGDYAYGNGSYPEVMDVIDIPFVERRPKSCQTENHLMDTSRHWRKAGRLAWGDLEKGVDCVDSLWVNGYKSSLGQNDRIPEECADSMANSLLLVRSTDLSLLVSTIPMPFGETKRQIRAQFHFNRIAYNIVVTDLYIEARCENRKDGAYPVPEAYVCVSIGEPIEGNRYKLAAAIITPNRAGQEK